MVECSALNGVSISPLLRFRENHRRGNGEDIRAKCREICDIKMSSGHDITIVLLNPVQLRLLEQDSTPHHVWGVVHEAQSSLRDYWEFKLIGWERSII